MPESAKVDELEELLKRLAGDPSSESSWAALYRRLWPFVIGTVFRTLGGNRDAAEDVAQEVFLRLVKFCDFSAFPNAPAFLGYLHAITRNVARDSVRKQESHQPIEGVESHLSSGHEQAKLDAHLMLRKIFAELDPEELALAEYLLKGYTLKEISQLMHQTYGSLAVRFHRLRARLRQVG